MRVAILQVPDVGSIEKRIEWVRFETHKLQNDPMQYDIIILPELWRSGFFNFQNYKVNSETMDGDTVRLAKELAQMTHSNVVSGSFIENDNGKYYNTTAVISREGELLGKYRKMHLFGYESAERELLTSGNDTFVLEIDSIKIGFSTCYDLRFPEQYRKMVDQGSEIFIVVSAWPEARLNHWRLFNQARALENQSFLISCNCAGIQNGTLLAGHSMIVAPDGMVLKEADLEGTCMIADIHPDQVMNARQSFPALHDRCEI